MFSGPWTFNLDFGALKTTAIREGHSLEFRADAFNLFNHATFAVFDQYINSVSFGRVSDTYFPPRMIQFGLHYRF